MAMAPPTRRRHLHPAVRTVWWVQSGMAVSVPVAAALIVSAVVDLPGPVRITLLVVATALVAVALVGPVLAYRAWSYELGEDDLRIHSGVLWRKVTIIPYIRLQFVDTTQGPIERLLGLSRLVVHTAAVGTSGALPGLASEDATELRDRLSRLEGDTGGL